MKDEEFNNFLRERADSFELKPSSSSFDAVLGKMKKKNKRKGVYIFITLFVGVVSGIILMYGPSQHENTIAVAEPQATTTPNAAANQAQEGQTNNAANNTSATANAPVAQQSNNKPSPQQAVVNTPAVETKNTTPQTPKSEPIFPKELLSGTNNGGAGIETENKLDNSSETTDAPQQVETTFANADEEEKAEESEEKPLPAQVQQELDGNRKVAKDNQYTDSQTCNCNDKKWVVKAHYSPFTAFYTSTFVSRRDESNSLSPSVIQINNFSEEPKGGWAIGAKAERRLSNRWAIGFGLGYSKLTTEQYQWRIQQYDNYIPNYTYDSATNTYINTGVSISTTKTLTDSVSTRVTLQSLQLPIYARYAFACKNRWQFDLQAGVTATYTYAVSFNELYRAPQAFIGMSADIANYEENYQKFNAVVGLGLGINYKYTNRIGFYATQNFSMPIYTIHSNAATMPKHRLLFMGFETGVRFSF